MKKAIFLDVDGTILNCNMGKTKISDKVKKAIRSAQEKGHYVFVASGRPYAFLGEELLNFGFSGFILANGAHVIVNNKTIYKKFIDKDFIKKCINMFENNNIQYIFQGEKYSYMKEKFQEYYDFYEKFGIGKRYIKSDYDENNLDILKMEMLCMNEDISKKCYDFVKNSEGYDFDKSINEKFFELYSKENTKASGILKALDYLNIPIKNSYAFGDGKNDIEMLSTVGYGIAMENASEEVKKHVKYITGSVDDDGVAEGIYKYVLN